MNNYKYKITMTTTFETNDEGTYKRAKAEETELEEARMDQKDLYNLNPIDGVKITNSIKAEAFYE